MAGDILRPLPARGSVRGLFLAKPAHVEREAVDGHMQPAWQTSISGSGGIGSNEMNLLIRLGGIGNNK